MNILANLFKRWREEGARQSYGDEVKRAYGQRAPHDAWLQPFDDAPVTGEELGCDARSLAARCGVSAVVFAKESASRTTGYVEIPSGVALVLIWNLPPGTSLTLITTAGLSVTTALREVSPTGALLVGVTGQGQLAFSGSRAIMATEMGIGGVTDTSAVWRARANQDAILSIEHSANADLSNSTTSFGIAVDATSDYTGGGTISGLPVRARRYYCIRVNDERQHNAPFPYFDTFPAEGVDAAVTIVAGSCMETPSEPLIFAAIAAENPNVLIHEGDFHYGDTTVLATQRRAYQAQYASDFLTHIVRKMPRAHTWDDHDYGGGNEDGGLLNKENSLRAFNEYLPLYPLASPGIGVWHSFRIANAEVFMLDTRSQREDSGPRFPSTATELVAGVGSRDATVVIPASARPATFANAYRGYYVTINGRVERVIASAYDLRLGTHTLTLSNPVTGLIVGVSSLHLRKKSMLDQDLLENGQTEWLIASMNASTAKWKILATSVIWNPTYTTGASDIWGGWDADQLERRYIQQHVTAKNVIVLSGDRHNAAIDDGTNSGWPEMTASPFNQTNARFGGRWSHGTRTSGHSYGVLALDATHATLTIKDENGNVAAGVSPLRIAAV